jgi:hypothetical protein
MSRLDRLLAALALCCAVSRAMAAAPPLLLEVWRNGATDHAIVHLTQRNGVMLIPAAELPLLGVKVTASSKDGQVDLADLAGVKAAIDMAGQRLLLTAAPRSLPRQLYDLGAGAAPPPTEAAAGAILRYDLSVTDSDARRFGSALSGGTSLGLDLFRGNARFSATGFGNWAKPGASPVSTARSSSTDPKGWRICPSAMPSA